jgi:Tfp pilus assembly protein PilF
VLAAAAMLAKEMAVTLPLILLLGAFISRVRKAWPLVTAHVVVAVVYLTLRTSVVGRVGQEDVTVHSVLVGLREAPVLLVAYLRLAVMPFGHSMAYVVGTPGTLKLALTCAGLAGGAVLAWWVDRRYRPAPGLRYALGWFTITLLPVLHLVPLWADLADRFLLVPSVGVALFVASIGMWLPERRRAFAAVAALALAVAYAVGVRVESRFWRSEVALWSNAVAEAPGSALAHWNLGSALLGVDPAGALAELERARSLGRGGADLSLRRGMALAALDRHAEAEAAVLAALAEDPGLHRAHAVLGEILIRLGKIPEAKRELASARALTPEHPSTALLEGALAYAEGRLRDAASAYAALAARFPSQARFQFLAAQSAERAGDRAAAKEHARKCLQLAPEQEQCREITGRP